MPARSPIPRTPSRTLNQAVCDGKIKLRAAQAAIARNWLKAEAALGLGG